ncbi:helix-turn-helix domain-containing protein [Empedobacter tilapiae]|uniref:AraC family transcriptional regulator n=1 Tax=Empedobacter tilapiae TaxID=2491114 RepID=A0A4Z1BBL8_9FLAO|nr:AraC family transcriptional regulator [Empedobacter tilapiae]TGN21882.1 AraC family transcriptional regulator [Empedobacter tilapiae]
MEKKTSIDQFYQEMSNATGQSIYSFLPPDISKDIGHFNIFDIAETFNETRRTQLMPYNKRMYYKISMIRGHNLAEYADKTFEIKKNALLFATPKIPYHWLPQDEHQSGFFCVFTDDFLVRNKTGVVLDDLPIFQTGAYPIFQIDDEKTEEVLQIFRKMQQELHSDYRFKYDLIRNYVLELIHFGQKLQPLDEQNSSHNAAARVTSLFIELLERQFPIESPNQKLNLRTAKDFAERLSVHVNHLNKVLKESIGKTTTEVIGNRIVQEAKYLLKQTNWNVSEIAYSLGFEEVAHFSNFFKKHTQLTPLAYRS